jgi:hypothetical protein
VTIQAGVGLSHQRNPEVAGQEAAQQALEAAGVEKPDFLFTFAAIGYDQAALVKAVREATEGGPLCGCSGEGIIAGGEADESNFSVGVMAISSDQLRFSHGLETGLREDPTGAGRAIAQAIQPEVGPDTLALFLFPDGITVNFDRLAASLEEELNLDYTLPLVGGTAGTIQGMSPTYQYCDDQVVSDGVAWALLSGEARIAWAVNHGCVPVGVEHKVTGCEENLIYEIDGRPIVELLRDYMGDDALEDLAKMSNTFSIGLEAPGYLEDLDEYVIRAIVTFGLDEVTDSVDYLGIPTEIAEGTSIWVARRDYEKLSHGVGQVAEDIKARLGEDPASLVFQFDCAARGKVFLRERQKLQLLETLQGRIGLGAPWLGFYTFGEIAPVGGHNCFHNYTVVLTVIY